MSYHIYKTWGFSIFLDAEESPMMKNRTVLTYETEKFKWLIENLTKQDVFVDVGANKGDFTLLAASRCSKIYSIEPHPDNLIWLYKNISLNNFSNVLVIEGCANDVDGDVLLWVGDKSGYHSIVRKTNLSIVVRGFRLDIPLLNEKSIIMKIDVEGAEISVLNGCQNILDNIKFLLIDVDGGDIEKVKKILNNYDVVFESHNELFLKNRRGF